jgi:uncharacterized protein YjbJ (UPF0337 family)
MAKKEAKPKGTLEQFQGMAQQTVGKLTGSEKQQAKGKTKEMHGKATHKTSEAKHKTQHASSKAQGKMKA